MSPTGFEIPRPAKLQSLLDSLRALLGSPLLLRGWFALLRRFAPVLRVRKSVTLARHADVVEALQRDGDFSVVAINGRKMDALGVPFMLGMDPGERYARERVWLDACMLHEDLPLIRSLVRARCEEILHAATPEGVIDVAGEYARAVAISLVQQYFGVPGPDSPTLMRWLRALFQDLFLNLGDNATVHARAVEAARGLESHLRAEIARRADPTGQTVLDRLIRLRASDPSLDTDGVRRSISGVIVGAVDTTSKAFCQALDQLLRRPAALADAGQAARRNDVARVGAHVLEALRFNPHNPLIVRHCPREIDLGPAPHTRIPAGSTVYASTLSAMFDPSGYANPASYAPDRKEKHLLFGGGLHRCYGEAINGVTLPELATALLSRADVRRDGLLRGRIWYDGPFPDSLFVRFAPAPSAQR